MRRLSQTEVVALFEALGYFGTSPLFLTSGRITGPKGFWWAPLDPGEYVTLDELLDFLLLDVGLLDDDVRDAIAALPG